MTSILRNEILKLEKVLAEKRSMLFLSRLETIANCPFNKANITDVSITLNTQDHTWQITYQHKTQNFNLNHYINDEDSEDESETGGIPKETRITFGKSSKYFIRGGIKFNVYRNTAGELRIINPDYEFDLDLDEQRALVRNYSENHDLPEWFAIATLLYLSDNKWDDQSFVNHLSIV